MEQPNTKVIVWTGGRWVDQETGVYASNLRPPPGDTLEQHHFDKSFTVTYEQVQQMIDEAFDRRIAGGSTLHYFDDPLDDNLIVPYSFWRSLDRQVQEFDARLTVIEHRQP